jgi:hypothetical protein
MAKSESGTVVQRRRERWRELLRRWRASGLSQAEFCRRHGVAVWKLAWWKRRLAKVPFDREARTARKRRSDRSVECSASFVPVGVLSTSVRIGRMELLLGAGRRLRFAADVDPGKLAEIVAALERVAVTATGSSPC